MVDVNRFISRFTTDPRTRAILQNISQIDSSPDARCVLKSFLTVELTQLINKSHPNLAYAARSFVAVPDPKSIYRAFQLYIWMKEEIPKEHDRESLILLGMLDYIEGEKRTESARQMIDYLAIT